MECNMNKCPGGMYSTVICGYIILESKYIKFQQSTNQSVKKCQF